MSKSSWSKTALFTNLLLVPFDIFIVFAAVFLLRNLSDAAKLAEMSKIAGLLLTVEGILLGLSPLVFDKLKGLFGPIFVTVAALALLWSLVTIMIADTGNFDQVYTIYLVDLAFFQAVIISNVLSAWRRYSAQL